MPDCAGIDLFTYADQRLRHIVALSGGKDSTAMALRLAEVEPREYTYVCTPTGNELPEMVDHWERLEGILGQPIVRIQERTLFGLIIEQRALPNHAARWCTRILKLENFYAWCCKQGPAISYVGLRADEESRAGMTFRSEGEMHMDFPMKRWGWTISDVREYLAHRGVTIPKRTDCAVCFWQKIGEWYELWRDHPDLYEQGVIAEEHISKSRGRQYTFRSPQRDSWPASLRELRERFRAGEVPDLSLRRMKSDREKGDCRACTL